MSRYPQRLSREQWREVREWYDDDVDWTEANPESIDFPASEPDEHDRRFSDQYDQRNGDIGDEDLPPF